MAVVVGRRGATARQAGTRPSRCHRGGPGRRGRGRGGWLLQGSPAPVRSAASEAAAQLLAFRLVLIRFVPLGHDAHRLDGRSRHRRHRPGGGATTSTTVTSHPAGSVTPPASTKVKHHNHRRGQGQGQGQGGSDHRRHHQPHDDAGAGALRPRRRTLQPRRRPAPAATPAVSPIVAAIMANARAQTTAPASALAPPSPPTAVRAGIGHSSSRVTWSPPIASGSAPVSGVNVYVGTVPGGEAVAPGQRRNADHRTLLRGGQPPGRYHLLLRRAGGEQAACLSAR